MSEHEWAEGTNPRRLLESLPGNCSDRKLRLLSCAFCKRIWEMLDDRSRIAVETSERYADGLANDAELNVARAPANRALAALINGPRMGRDPNINIFYHYEKRAAIHTTVDSLSLSVVMESLRAVMRHQRQNRDFILDTVGRVTAFFGRGPVLEERSYFCQVVRCIFGNPFRPVAFNPAWPTATVTSLADAIYTDRAFDRLPILADALEDAGCTNRDVLDHCRQPGEHVRGCWVLDLVLGKS